MGKFFENHAYLLLHNCEFIFLSCDRFIAASGNIKKKKKEFRKKTQNSESPTYAVFSPLSYFKSIGSTCIT